MRLSWVVLSISIAAAVDITTINPLVIEAEYAVRGAILDRASQIEKELLVPGHKWPFEKIVHCNIGNPQALGQAPPTFARQVLAKVVGGGVIEGDDEPSKRARAYSDAIKGGVGAYSESQGVAVVRKEVADFIQRRDGLAADPADIFLTNGASEGVRLVMQLLLRGAEDAVLAPAPQYPLYSALAKLANATLAPYYLDEGDAWAAPVAELERAYADAVSRGATPRGLVVINPGNPTGASLPRSSLEEIVDFCDRRNLVLLADEVYQENVYADAPPFVSMRKVSMDMKRTGPVISFHSVSKGFTGECGMRGGYFELQNIPDAVKQQLVKLASISLCSNLMGQLAVGLMVHPPRKGTSDHAIFALERDAKLASLARRATLMQQALTALPGVHCEPAQGAMYLFPQLSLPPAAVDFASSRGMQPDALYALELLERTGLVVVPGSGFGQKNGTWHFRTTFLPPEDELDQVVTHLGTFHAGFLERYGAGKTEL
ncbi:pyridoxal phosphate-dependent transferase [Pelagophyceae sp. CCMP2097]|nr:pyridoxal phosphate-dependent transferase [Pelagophyceae sp. CCMP2097]